MSNQIIECGSEIEEFNPVEKYTMDHLLDIVDYDFPGYAPSVQAFEFFNFIRLVYGEEPENSNPIAHYFLIDVIFKNVNPFEYYNIRNEICDPNFIVLCATREFSKSVLIGTMLPLYMAYYGVLPGSGKVNFGFYIGNSEKFGVKQTMRTIETVYNDSIFLQDKFEYVKFTDSSVILTRHRSVDASGIFDKKDHKVASRTFQMDGYGAMGGPRSARSGLVRPQFGIADDLIRTEADSRSDVLIRNINSMIDSDIVYALHGSNAVFIFIGTPFNTKDPIVNSITSGIYMPLVFPICEKIDIGIKKDEWKGVWEDRHTYEKVIKKYKKAVHNGTRRNFMQEQMLRIADDNDRIVKDNMILYKSRKDILKYGSSYNFFITTDLTTTATINSDYCAIGLWAYSSNSDLILLECFVEKVDIRTQYNKIFEFVSRYKRFTGRIEVGIEVDASQGAHIFAIREMMTKHNNYFTIANQQGTSREGILRQRVKGNKFDYFLTIFPLFQSGKIFFAEELKGQDGLERLLVQLSYLTSDGIGSKNDDALDMLSQIGQINKITPRSNDEMCSMSYDPETDSWIEDEDDFPIGIGYDDYESTYIV